MGYFFFTHQLLRDMHLAYGAAGKSVRRAKKLYEDWYFNRIIMQHQIFAQLNCYLCESVSFRNKVQDTGRRRLTRTVNVEKQNLQSIEDHPNTSTPAFPQLNFSQFVGCWTSNVHILSSVEGGVIAGFDYQKSVEFPQWFMPKGDVESTFPLFASDIFTDDASFSLEGVFNAYYSHVWVYDNPCSTRSHDAEHRFAVNVRGGIIDNFLLGPYLLSPKLDSRQHLFFLERM